MTPLERAVQIVGGQTALAKVIGTKQANVWNWLNRPTSKVPPEFCAAIEAATEGEVTRRMLRPDVFGDTALALPKPGDLKPSPKLKEVIRGAVAKKNVKRREP